MAEQSRKRSPYDSFKEGKDTLRSRLYDSAATAQVYQCLGAQPRVNPHPPANSQSNQLSALYRATLLRKEKQKKKLLTENTSTVPHDSRQINKTQPDKLLYDEPTLSVSPPKLGTSCKRQEVGPDRYGGLDVIQVIQILRKRLNWETDVEKIIKDGSGKLLNKSFGQSGQNLHNALYPALPDDGVFAYARLRDYSDSIARYNPYDLVCINAKDTLGLKQMFTVTASAVTQTRENTDADLVSMPRWLYERKIFYKIFHIPVFSRFRIWKAFTTWKNYVRASMTTESRQNLHENLSIVDDVLQNALLKIRTLCEEQCSSLKHEPAKLFFLHNTFGAKTLTLEQFAAECSQQAEYVQVQLQELRATCLLLTANACQSVIERHSGLLQWIKLESDVKPDYIQIVQWRSVLSRLYAFVRSIDFVILELLRRLVVNAAHALLAKIQASSQYSWQPDNSTISHEEGPPAVLRVRLMLEVPKDEVEKDLSSPRGRETLDSPAVEGHCSTTSKGGVPSTKHSQSGRSSSSVSQSTVTTSVVDFNPSTESFISAIYGVLSKFQEIVSSYKSFLTAESIKSLVTPPSTDLVYALRQSEMNEDCSALESWPDVQLIFGKDPDYQNTITSLITLVKEDIHRVQAYSETYKVFCDMVDVCRSVDVDASMVVQTWAYDEFHSTLTRHTDQVKLMREMVLKERIGLFMVEMNSFYESCLPYPALVLQRVHHHLPIVAARANNLLLDVIKKYNKNLEKLPTSVEEFMERLNLQARVARELPQLEQEFIKVSKLYSLIVTYEIHVEPMEMALYQTLMPSFYSLKSTMLFCEAKKDENILKFSNELETLISNVRVELIGLKNKIRSPRLIDPQNSSTKVLEKLTMLGEELETISHDAGNYATYQDHFLGALSTASRRKVAYSRAGEEERKKDNAGALLRDVAEVERDLSLRKLLWKSSDQWKDLVQGWKEKPFEMLNVEEMQKTVSKLMQTLFMLEKGVPANSIVSQLKKEVLAFKQGMPAIINLRNPALRSRHWDAVQTLMGKAFVRDERFTLGKLLQMNVFCYKAKIVEISSFATNEYTLEQMLCKVMDYWNRTDFNLTVHSTRDIGVITGADEISTALEDSMVTLTNIKSSRHVTPVKVLVEEWDRKLSLFSLTLEEWLICQRHWLYLESIFAASDIQRQLPNETRLFAQVDRSWTDIMRRVADRPNALHAATAPGVLEVLQTCNTHMDKIHKCLEDYLETKRLVFSKFYFLSNDDLIDVLSNGKNPEYVQPHLKKCFANVHKLGLKRHSGSLQVHHVISAEDECIALQTPVKIRGAVEVWLSTVEMAIFRVVKLYLKQAISRSNEEFRAWVLGHPGQVVLTVSQVLFCKNVVSCMESKEKAFLALQEKQCSTVNALVSLVMSPLLFNQRQSVEALLTIKVHERDVLQSLIDDNIGNPEDFQWKRQLRYNWNDSSNSCKVMQHNASIEYGYEYLGCPSRLVITPLTDRCYLTLTGALHMHLGGAPFGPAGTGKTETVKDLAKAMGKQCVVFNCSESLDYKMTGRFFSGIAQSGSWFCFDEFNRIDVEVLSVIAQQLHAIKTAKDTKASWFVFEGRDISLDRDCGVCITMNPGYKSRVELPDNVKSLFRPFAMMVPDYVLITQIILFSEGFATATTLSKKIVKLYELVSSKLSQQDHYDFGLRSMKSTLLFAGQHKRSNPRPDSSITMKDHEAGLLLKAIQSTNLPKLVTEDIPLFEQILVDLFPSLPKPPFHDRIFQKAIKLALEELNLSECPSQIDKVSYLHKNLLSRHGIALVGATGGGKTTMRNILKEAVSLLPILNTVQDRYLATAGTACAAEFPRSVIEMKKDEILISKYAIGKKAQVSMATINPKCVSLGELYGSFNPSTMEWKDGLLSSIFRQFSSESNGLLTSSRVQREKDQVFTLIDDEESAQKRSASSSLSNAPCSNEDISAWFWIVLDGPVDTVWAENLNSVLDDTKLLCLSSGERISTGPGMKLFFEVDNLLHASPATVSRCAVVYVDPNDLGWTPYVKTWLARLTDQRKIADTGRDHLSWLFNVTLDEGLEFRRSSLPTDQVNQTCDLSVVKCLCSILQSLVQCLYEEDNISNTSTSPNPESDCSSTADSRLSHVASSAHEELLSKLYLFSYTWSIGCPFVAPVDDKDYVYTPSASLHDIRKEQEGNNVDVNENTMNCNPFDGFTRNLFNSYPALEKTLPPAPHSIFDFFLDLGTEQFVLWQTLVPRSDVLIQQTLTQSAALADSLTEDLTALSELIPTKDTTRYEFLLSLLLLNSEPVLLTGNVGVGKSILVEDVLLRLSKEGGVRNDTIMNAVLRPGSSMTESPTDLPRCHIKSVRYSTMQCSARLTPVQVQTHIVGKLVKNRRYSLGAQEGFKIIVFMDDLNMPEKDEFGSQPPLELLRQYLDQGGFYDTRKLQWTKVDNVTVVSACGPPTGGRHSMSPRIVRHFNVLFLPHPAVKALHRIFQVRLGRHLQNHDFMPEIREMYQELVFATLSVFFVLSASLLPTPAKSHYTFNIKDVNKVISGLLQAHHLAVTSHYNMVLLFAHEASRVFHDRLINNEDRNFFFQVLEAKIDECIRCKVPMDILNKKSLIFGDFAEVNNPKADRLYRQVKDGRLLARNLQEFYDRLRLSDENFEEHFVFFRQAVEHLSRAARVFRQSLGHLLLVGVGGTGKSSVVKLAAYLENCEFKTLRSMSNYTAGDFHDDVKCALFAAGIDGKNTVLFFNDKNLVKSFFEDISYMLNGREVPQMFNKKDKERIFLNLRDIAKSAGVSDDKSSVFDFFKQRASDHVHLAISMTPSGSLFRHRTLEYPSLINCCSIDWYDEWPSEALQSVGNTLLQSMELQETSRLTKLSVDVYHTCQETASQFWTELSRHCHATPATYIECIQMFKKIYAEKYQEYLKHKERLRSGIVKLDESYELVGKMKHELTQLGPELEKKAKDTENLLNQLAKDQESVDQVRRVVSNEEASMNEEARKVQETADQAQRDLDQALPALLAANKELDTLEKSDIAEIRVYTKPPGMVMTVMAAVCLILDEKTDWTNTKQVLADPGFLKRLITFDANSVSDKVLAKLKRYTTHPNFTPDHVGKISVACQSMCRWVIALDGYSEVYRVVLPKQAKCEEAFRNLHAAKCSLLEKQTALVNVEHQLKLLQEQYKASLKELDALHQRKHLTTLRLERASVLSRAFTEEHVRWLESVNSLEESSQGLLGDAFLSGATIAYLGPFTQNFRTRVYSQWCHLCRKQEIRISSKFDFSQFLSSSSEIQKWLSYSLPYDTTSIQSAVVVKHARKWPLLIDPQQQALKWISEMERGNGVKIVKSSDVSCLAVIEEAVQLGKPVVVTDVGERLDPRLESVLQRRVKIQDDKHVMKINETEVEYNNNFKLYLATPISNPMFFPEIFNKVTVINFTVTFEGLQDQLLSKVVFHEHKELEKKFSLLLESIRSDRAKIKALEDKCLDLLHNSHGNILDDEELIQTLEGSKNMAVMIQNKVEQSEAAQREIRRTREDYLPVATRGAIIYFTLVDLPSLNIMYQFSLQWFVHLFVSSLLSPHSAGGEFRANSPLLGTLQAGTVQPLYRLTKRNRCNVKHEKAQRCQLSLADSSEPGLQPHLIMLIEGITETVYRQVTYGLFARHHTAFSFLLCCNIMKYCTHDGVPLIANNEWSLFVWGALSPMFGDGGIGGLEKEDNNLGTTGVHYSKTSKPPLKWITAAMWQECQEISSQLTSFFGLCSHVALHRQFWLDFFRSDDPYLFLGKDQELSKGEGGWSHLKLSTFQRLMLVKILRPERLLHAVRTFVQEHLGPLFVSASPLNLQEIFAESDPKVPLLFILAPGSDPASQLVRFVRDVRGSTYLLDMISLGRGQEVRTEDTVTKSYTHRGHWVFLQNCHLASSFMPQLKELVRKIAEPTVAVEPSFRLWLSSAPDKDFPVSILQAATKMTVESLPGIKANILQSFATVGGAVTAGIFEDNNLGPHWKKVLFGLCLFNAVIQERKKFGALGWNIPYVFSSSDLEVSISMLRMLLTEHRNVPWGALVYLTSEVTFGGRVSDIWDKRCLVNIVETFCSPECLRDNFSYSSSKLYLPPSINMSFADCCDYIESLPSVDPPELFGMQSEANQCCLKNEADCLLDDLNLVHPQVENISGPGKTNDEIVLRLLADIQHCLPMRIGSLDQRTSRHDPKHPTNTLPDPMDDPTPSSPIHTVLQQEVVMFNRLLSVIHASLSNLLQAVHGEVLMSIEIEATYKSLLANQVPMHWQKVSYNSTKALASWVNNLVQRISFFSRWIEAIEMTSDLPVQSIQSLAERTSSQDVFISPDMPRAFWISAFFFPKGFFTSVLQRHARVRQVPVDSLKLNYEITERVWLPEDVSHERNLDVNRVAFHGTSQDDCIRVFGLYLDGAVWDVSSACLKESRVEERFPALPEVKILPVMDTDEVRPCTNVELYECPVYSTPARGISFILAIHLPSRRPPKHWITRGVALISQLAE